MAELTAAPLEIRPKQVKALIDALPVARPQEAAAAVLRHLGALNRTKVDPDDRLAILELYQPPVALLLEELDAIYGKSILPLPPKAREALTAARTLAAEMAAGFKIVLIDKTSKRLAFGVRRQLPQLIFGGMRFHARQLVAGYKAYAAPAEGVWSEMHRLYLLAEQEGLAAEPVDPQTKESIFDVYTEQLLLALTDPYRLVQGDLERVVAQLRAVRTPVTLGRERPPTRQSAHFLVPCDTDRPPKPLLSANDDPGGPNARLLDTNALVDRLRQRKQAVESGNASAATSKALGAEGIALLGKLISLWGDPPKRAHRRDPMDTSVAIVIGLKSIAHFVTNVPKPDPAEAEKIRAGITMPLPVVAGDEESKTHPVHEWNVVNQSRGGLKVSRTSPALQPLLVGEAVGIRFMSRPCWAVGVVRWLTTVDEGRGMEFGVQFLAPDARMVWLQPVTGATPQAKQALLLPENPAAAEALLTPLNTYSDLREYEMREEAQVSAVRATALIEKTARFELFRVSPS
jgi:cyclic-di-GMP-binding protein